MAERGERKLPFIVFGRPSIEEPEIQEVVETLRSGWIGTGPRVTRFEEDFATYKGVARASAVNSCTAALHLSLLAAGVGSGDEVITTALTFASTVNAIVHTGAHPVLADVDPRTMNLDVADAARRITPRTRVILAVHFGGRVCAMPALMDLARSAGLKVIEDCAHAIETELDGRKAGTFGDFGCFSFYATKNLTTAEGGMILAARDEDIARVRVLALHGLSKDAWQRYGDAGYRHYAVLEPGFKYNMTDLQAALGIWQLRRIEENWRRRARLWRRYLDALAPLPLTLPLATTAGERHAYHLFTVLVDAHRAGVTRDEFLERLTTAGVGAGVHYNSIPTHPYYRRAFGWRPEDWPAAHAIGQQTVSLPLSANLTDEEQTRVIDAVERALER
jgi:dTDP-4-amino-4,6-dideoxygalactose transaminase